VRNCPRCGQPLVRDVREEHDIERCTRQGCNYYAWIVPLEHTKVRPKYGKWYPVEGKT